MINRVLVANRGEVALRVVRACRDLGIGSVQAFSDADSGSLAVSLADDSIAIGPAPARLSYLNKEAIVAAAILSGCDAIHPGYGFLAENAEFAKLCERNAIVFIGPDACTIRRMGDKAAARLSARASQVPTVPGSNGPVATVVEARALAAVIGFPFLLKAAAGGGGKGMRVVEADDALEEAFVGAQAEAAAAFGDPRLYIERYLTDIRHIEVQVVGDGTSVIHVGDRDCTLQRRHQKLVEEAPSPFLRDEVRAALTEAALRMARSVGYRSVGTVEFVYDKKTEAFFFIEMNTRLQVEHPVTEMVTGIDLVAEQIRIAGGAALSIGQDDVRARGHAIECRILAEDPDRNFLPQPGMVSTFNLPSGPWVRVDSAVIAGCVVPPFYDSLLAKIVAWGASREEARARMARALTECQIEGLRTNIKLQTRLVMHPGFRDGNFNTTFVENIN